MTYPHGRTPGWPPDRHWQQPPLYPPQAMSPSSGHHHHQDTADLRERLARLETGHQHTTDWLRHVAEQTQGLDERVRKTADIVTTHTAALAKLDGLPSRLERDEAERKFKTDLLRYAAAGAIVIAVALSKGDLSQVAQIVSLLLGKGAVP
jgi:hypothetical protein